MPRTSSVIAGVWVVVLAASYQIYFRPLLAKFGVGRVITPVGNTDCTTIPELKACEKIVLHQPTGVIYLACSTPESRTHWTPAVDRLNAAGMSTTDYVATFDPKTSKITKLSIAGYTSGRGLALHGMDVVPSASDANELFVYLVNHRRPLDASAVGADSVIEIFRTSIGSSTLTHVKTVEDPVIDTPNDVVGYSDGKSFHFTNDHGSKSGFLRTIELFDISRASVGYCHIDEGCKIAVANMHANNGIAKAPQNDTIYVANCNRGGVTILEKQLDNTLVRTDTIATDYPLDNLAVDENGALWAAGIPDALTTVFTHFQNPSIPAPSAGLRITLNFGPGSFYGEKYKVDKVFEDDGTLASGVTTVVYDSQRKRLFLNGLASPQLVICKA
ncbi:hypothetical protein HGRIS_002204 [Hohenbuehelia grisea]|uniref:Calcium-dependent phosphotriesterase n=1 Tax=Hohenbuehelia grisea TaxID=104357 RepID=A0ABR3JKH1_9AGAR